VVLVRSIGKWALAGLMVNAMIGSGVFGVPGELIRLVGAPSPYAFLIAGLAMMVIVACVVEVSSQFNAAGGAYLYVRTAFGRLAGLQVAWFYALTPVAAAAAHANLFVNYLAGFAPALGEGALRSTVITILISVPTLANVFGAQAGKTVSSVLVIGKLLPLVLLIAVGLFHPGEPSASAAVVTGDHHAGDWLTALMLAAVCFGGFEDALAATGEIKEPRRTIASALAISLGVCIILYALIQLITVRTLGNDVTNHPLAAVASVLLGPRGAALVGVAAMVSTAGAISALVVAAPRIFFALAEHGELPAGLARVHGHRSAPVSAILFVAAVILILALSGTYRWALAVTAGSAVIVYGSVCASLISLRLRNPGAAAFRIPFGVPVAVAGVLLSLLLVAQLQPHEAALMGVIVLIAGAHWLCVREWRVRQGSYLNRDAR
jgi:basic amino acid/polyamine antiporter, APA family